MGAIAIFFPVDYFGIFLLTIITELYDIRYIPGLDVPGMFSLI